MSSKGTLQRIKSYYTYRLVFYNSENSVFLLTLKYSVLLLQHEAPTDIQLHAVTVGRKNTLSK